MNIKLKVIKDFEKYKANDIIFAEVESICEDGGWVCDAVYDDGFFVCDMKTEFFDEHLKIID